MLTVAEQKFNPCPFRRLDVGTGGLFGGGGIAFFDGIGDQNMFVPRDQGASGHFVGGGFKQRQGIGKGVQRL